jgi:hypothetical protein
MKASVRNSAEVDAKTNELFSMAAFPVTQIKLNFSFNRQSSVHLATLRDTVKNPTAQKYGGMKKNKKKKGIFSKLRLNYYTQYHATLMPRNILSQIEFMMYGTNSLALLSILSPSLYLKATA